VHTDGPLRRSRWLASAATTIEMNCVVGGGKPQRCSSSRTTQTKCIPASRMQFSNVCGGLVIFILTLENFFIYLRHDKQIIRGEHHSSYIDLLRIGE
jgi:hypothetical protein